MGGSILGAKAIYSFLKPKIKFTFIDSYNHKTSSKLEKKNIQIIISKSGNTLETLTNLNIHNNNNKKIIITEKNSYLYNLANKLKSDVVEHNNYIGGRYSVLSEVGMLPAKLMGFKPSNFRVLNNLVKNNYFINALIENVSSILEFLENKKSNSIILNYDETASDLFKWYQQLIGESLGKKSKGILPLISVLPRDNHSLMQYYLDGPRNNFFTFFFTKEKTNQRFKNKKALDLYPYLVNKNSMDILYSQFCATKNVFKKKKIPFRAFVVDKRSEEVMGELFTFFILEIILLGQALNINPYDQPSVELIKKETLKQLKKS